ncbi:integrin beta pat-3 [Aplysia californica]|uniref:Integrin beta n=1 Tax=Aplysia californica TaxID=6500 RepID=A0ABM0JID2_APLCA|nr:integrin beta pat-3 [Aplysia californica]XP_012935684.1 integrin beta pat-3 [Aplysia californica]XP_035824622.1 integrin beta pat-3 [Aplysia californica]XP_035824623.1 integrin beta pat-3 [Aplysia californica]
MKNITAGLLALSLCVLSVWAQTIEDEFSNPCTIAKTCGQCIRTSSICSWCGAEVYPRGMARCDIVQNLKRNCTDKDISSPKSTSETKRNDEWTSGGKTKPPVQVRPQEVEFVIRPNDPMNFKLHFQQQANYPVDLYFLLDLSYGMARQKEAQQRLIALGEDMPVSLQNITNNFRLGFGTFVDKLLMPYTAWTDEMLQYRCPLKDKRCRDPHAFKNQVNLGENAPTFARKMRSALENVSQSLDDAEGGLEGLIQALDCNNIGWRQVSRRIIVYSSNSRFHLAGSGKLGGATKQSDLQCALNPDGLYENDKIYDYPSVSQIAAKLNEKKANVIFAVMKNVSSHYYGLRSFLDGAVVGELEDDSKNIVQLISEKYYDLRSRIKFQSSNDDHVELKFRTKCLGNQTKETSTCTDLKIGDKVEFDVTMTVNPDICKDKTGIVEKVVSLDAVGLNEQLLVKLKIRCECECESSTMEVLNSDKCFFGNGTLECGICNCNDGRYGRLCECDETQISSEEAMVECRKDVNDTATCSGNGECICGECECYPLANDPEERYSGEFCECNDYSCPMDKNNKLCGGSRKGVCSCGTCNCLPGWSGHDCTCTTLTESCIAANNKTCNGFGECECGVCVCDQKYDMVGPTCEDCPTCPSKCNEYIDCAQCTGFGTGSLTQDECDSKCGDSKKVDTLPSGEGIRNCDGRDVDGCTFYFTYTYTKDNEVIIRVQNTKKCPEDAPVKAIVGGTIAAVVLIPLLIICLIIFIRNRRDAKEFADFMKEREKAKWDSGANPIYKDPKSTFQNPTYKGGKK